MSGKKSTISPIFQFQFLSNTWKTEQKIYDALKKNAHEFIFQINLHWKFCMTYFEKKRRNFDTKKWNDTKFIV